MDYHHQFGTDIGGPQMMTPNDYGDPQILFHYIDISDEISQQQLDGLPLNLPQKVFELQIHFCFNQHSCLHRLLKDSRFTHTSRAVLHITWNLHVLSFVWHPVRACIISGESLVCGYATWIPTPPLKEAITEFKYSTLYGCYWKMLAINSIKSGSMKI